MTAPNVTNTEGGYAGPDRRMGFERRKEAPREAKDAPKLVNSVTVPGHERPFKPGSEKEFFEAAQKANEAAKKAGGTPVVDFERLEKAGAIAGFSKRGKGEAIARTTKSRQTERDGSVVQPEHDNAAPVPGGLSIEVVSPDPTGPTAARGQETAARTGGAGRTGGQKQNAPRGEKADGEASAARSGK